MSKIKNILYAFTFVANMVMACDGPHTSTREETLARQGWDQLNVLNFGNLKDYTERDDYPKPFATELSEASQMLTVVADVLATENDDIKSDCTIGSPLLFLNVSDGNDVSKIMRSVFTAAGECVIRNEEGKFVILYSKVSYGQDSVQIAMHSRSDLECQLLQDFLTGIKQSKDVLLRAITYNRDDPRISVLQNGPNWDSSIARGLNATLKNHFLALSYVAPSGLDWDNITGGEENADEKTNLYFDRDGNGLPVGSLGKYSDKESPNDFSMNKMLSSIAISSMSGPTGQRLSPDITIHAAMSLFSTYELRKLPKFVGLVNRQSPEYPQSKVPDDHAQGSDKVFRDLYPFITRKPIGATLTLSDVFPSLA